VRQVWVACQTVISADQCNFGKGVNSALHNLFSLQGSRVSDSSNVQGRNIDCSFSFPLPFNIPSFLCANKENALGILLKTVGLGFVLEFHKEAYETL